MRLFHVTGKLITIISHTLLIAAFITTSPAMAAKSVKCINKAKATYNKTLAKLKKRRARYINRGCRTKKDPARRKKCRAWAQNTYTTGWRKASKLRDKRIQKCGLSANSKCLLKARKQLSHKRSLTAKAFRSRAARCKKAHKNLKKQKICITKAKKRSAKRIRKAKKTYKKRVAKCPAPKGSRGINCKARPSHHLCRKMTQRKKTVDCKKFPAHLTCRRQKPKKPKVPKISKTLTLTKPVKVTIAPKGNNAPKTPKNTGNLSISGKPHAVSCTSKNRNDPRCARHKNCLCTVNPVPGKNCTKFLNGNWYLTSVDKKAVEKKKRQMYTPEQRDVHKKARIAAKKRQLVLECINKLQGPTKTQFRFKCGDLPEKVDTRRVDADAAARMIITHVDYCRTRLRFLKSCNKHKRCTPVYRNRKCKTIAVNYTAICIR